MRAKLKGDMMKLAIVHFRKRADSAEIIAMTTMKIAPIGNVQRC